MTLNSSAMDDLGSHLRLQLSHSKRKALSLNAEVINFLEKVKKEVLQRVPPSPYACWEKILRRSNVLIASSTVQLQMYPI